MKLVLDTNCFINTTSTMPCLRDPIQAILEEYRTGTVELHVSRHTLAELESRPDAAFDFAKTLPVLPHFPIGTWSDQVGCWEDLAGSWSDAEVNDSMQAELTKLAKSGNDIRDRGAFVDALRAKADVFVTSDKHLVGNGPAERIRSAFGLRILSPTQLLQFLKEGSPKVPPTQVVCTRKTTS
jgi:predicted nucleic acid-binding protein